MADLRFQITKMKLNSLVDMIVFASVEIRVFKVIMGSQMHLP